MRVRPCLTTATVLLSLIGVFGAASAAEPLRLAQRWTPLTGVLTPDAEQDPPRKEIPAAKETVPKETGSAKTVDQEKSAEPAKRAEPAVDLSGTAKLSLKATLARDVSDGQPRGSLSIKTTSVDADLADGLGLGSARGAMVSDASSKTAAAADLRLGDVIQKIDDQDVDSADGLVTLLKRFNPDQQVTLDVWRAGQGTADLKRLLVSRAEAGNVGASASLGRLISLGLVLGTRDFAEAAKYYLQAAEAGHLASMTRYALFAKDGIGIPKNEALAAKWFLKAAEGGQEAAMTNLGTLYETGRGATQDFTEAARWYRKAADLGHVFAMQRLALLYEAGRGVAKDDQEAVRLLQAASDKGLSEATSWLADKYDQGRGIPKDEDKALALNTRAADQVRKAAELGNAVATFNLGILYRVGKGVKKSDTEAAFWVVKSLKLGDKYLVSELMRNPNVLSVDDRKWLQTVLKDEGTYTGPINGTFSPDVRTAMEALAARA